MAVVDIATFIANIKDHSVDHGYHVHDERHFVETYTMRQAWEIDLHPDNACGGPLEIHLSIDVDPRIMIGFEDAVLDLSEDAEPPDEHFLALLITWTLPPLPSGPDILVLATELAGVGGRVLPLEVSASDSYAAVTDAPERTLSIASRSELSLSKIYMGQEHLSEVLARSAKISEYLLDRAHVWLDTL